MIRMATVVKWFAGLIPALWFGLSGMGAIASTSQALVLMNCVHLDAVNDFAFFRVERSADINYVPGQKSHDQGLYLLSEIAKQPITCEIDGMNVVLRVPTYLAKENGCSEENYQIELWIDDKIQLRTAPRSKGADCDYWSKNPFQGTLQVEANGYVTSCTDEITAQGSYAEPPLFSETDPEAIKKYEEEMREAEWRIEHTLVPFGTDGNLFYERLCG